MEEFKDEIDIFNEHYLHDDLFKLYSEPKAYVMRPNLLHIEGFNPLKDEDEQNEWTDGHILVTSYNEVFKIYSLSFNNENIIKTLLKEIKYNKHPDRVMLVNNLLYLIYIDEDLRKYILDIIDITLNINIKSISVQREPRDELDPVIYNEMSNRRVESIHRINEHIFIQMSCIYISNIMITKKFTIVINPEGRISYVTDKIFIKDTKHVYYQPFGTGNVKDYFTDLLVNENLRQLILREDILNISKEKILLNDFTRIKIFIIKINDFITLINTNNGRDFGFHDIVLSGFTK
jgi:hypothetical protein